MSEDRIVIENVSPVLDGGRHPVKRDAGGPCVVSASIFRDGTDAIRAALLWKRKGERGYQESPMAIANWGLDQWRGEFPLEQPGRYAFTIEAWTDRFASWQADLRKRVETGQATVRSETLEGIELVKAVLRAARGEDKRRLEYAVARLESAAEPKAAALAASDPELVDIMTRLQPRADRTRLRKDFEVEADRPLARFGAWYELFVRSESPAPGRPGTFRDALKRLPAIRAMGFDVLYLAPIYPIGRTSRKGRNGSLQVGPDDPGCPWAVGSDAGGHDAVEPALGTLEDFDRYVAEARRLGMEVALDFAIQCSPDHPWVKRHPEWFFRRPDGTIKCAENPPHRYDDICPLNFDSEAAPAIWEEMKRVLLFWIARGVRIFRVDNPHTKPVGFWRWLIDEIQGAHPDVVFLSEAFTRPPMMKQLAKVFTQSYTYFMWRNTKQEIVDYFTELAHPDTAAYFRPNLWPSTPDNIPPILQTGARPAFKARLVLAATLSPSYGIPSGFELCEHQVIAGTEEPLHSDKYEIRHRDWSAAGNLSDFIARVNAIRRENAALQHFDNLRFLRAEGDQIVAYLKASPDGSNAVIVVVNLNPFQAQESHVWVPPAALGAAPGGSYRVRDLLTGQAYPWSERNYVRLDPQTEPAHIFRVER